MHTENGYRSLSRVPVLPEDIVQHLKTIRGDGTPEFNATVHALVSAGWTLASISAPLGATRESVRLWSNRGAAGPSVEVPAAPPSAAARDTARRRQELDAERRGRKGRELDALQEYLPKLRELQPSAQSLRGPSASSEYYASASAEYTRLLAEAIDAGAPVVRLAEALGIKTVTIHARLRRWGYRKASPSERPVQWTTRDEVRA